MFKSSPNLLLFSQDFYIFLSNISEPYLRLFPCINKQFPHIDNPNNQHLNTAIKMTVLGWMHRKLTQKENEQSKCVASGRTYSCFSTKTQLDEQQYNPEPKYRSVIPRQTKTCSKTSTDLKDNRLEQGSLDMSTEFFHGFLSIGTLGAEPSNADPATLAFTMPFGQGAEEDAEITENELKLLNDQLEKFITYEVRTAGDETSERSIHQSIDKLSSKQTDSMDIQKQGKMVLCPLQEYLFGSSIESPESNEVKDKTKSNGGLLEKTSKAYKQYTWGFDEEEKQDKEHHAVNFMKKMLKKLHFKSRQRPISASGNAADTDSIKRKLPKVLRRSRKIHPETVVANSTKSNKHDVKNTLHNISHHDEYVTFEDHEIVIPKTARSNKETSSYRKSTEGILNSTSTVNRGHWIKTDAEYLVLEL